jgi:ABC-type sugar transport system permease subunit
VSVRPAFERSAAGPTSAVRPRTSWHVRRRWLTGYLFIAPLLLLFATYHVYPILRSFEMSFTNFKYLAPAGTRFVGLENYSEALADRNVWHGVAVATQYLVIYIPAVMLVSIGVALLLDRVANQFLAGIYRTVYYLPVVMPAVVVYVLWKLMYSPSIGLINYFVVDLLHLTATRPQWLASPDSALAAIALMEVWRYVGYNVLLLLVGLGGINRELYEAARIDGAGEWQLIWRITLPLLKPTLLVIMVLKMRIFAIVEPMLVAPGPGDSTWSWAYYAYQQAFVEGSLRMGYASAVGYLGALVMGVLVFAQYRLLRHERA